MSLDEEEGGDLGMSAVVGGSVGTTRNGSGMGGSRGCATGQQRRRWHGEPSDYIDEGNGKRW